MCQRLRLSPPPVVAEKNTPSVVQARGYGMVTVSSIESETAARQPIEDTCSHSGLVRVDGHMPPIERDVGG